MHFNIPLAKGTSPCISSFILDGKRKKGQAGKGTSPRYLVFCSDLTSGPYLFCSLNPLPDRSPGLPASRSPEPHRLPSSPNPPSSPSGLRRDMRARRRMLPPRSGSGEQASYDFRSGNKNSVEFVVKMASDLHRLQILIRLEPSA